MTHIKERLMAQKGHRVGRTIGIYTGSKASISEKELVHVLRAHRILGFSAANRYSFIVNDQEPCNRSGIQT